MKDFFLLCIILLTAAYSQESGCELSFLDIGAGARPRALGNAFVAIADDANAVFWNPAGISSLKGVQITGMHSSLFFGTKYDYLAVAAPLKRIYTDDAEGYRYGLGFAYIRASTGDIPLTQQGSDTIPGTNYPEIVYNGSASFTSNTGIVSLGTQFFNHLNLALLSRMNYIKLANFTGFGVNLGIATLMAITRIGVDNDADIRGNVFKIGVTFQDILPLKLNWSNDFKEKVLPTANLGGSFEFRKKILITGCLKQTLASGHHPGYGLGLEWKPAQVLPIRFGIEDKNFSTGAGFLSRRISLDYTIYIHQELPLSHYLSIGFRL
uniref:PorV/PorQ family protein n=1 Tax=candidate division WOR-3 bacterium TaxID=2052148 RepID=A0A7V3RH41_UNCW3